MSGFSEEVVLGFTYAYEGELVASERSAFQEIAVYRTPSFGAVLTLDGLVQTTEHDEFIYHEAIAHTPLLLHPEPRRVLIIGGGDGGTLRHVLMHPSVERAVMVEIDERVSAVCREHMPAIGDGAWDDPRADVRFDDGIAFVRDTDEVFDAIIVDSSDPVGPGEGLFSREFYTNARARLADGGVLVAQSGSPYFQQGELHRTYRNASSAFDDVHVFIAHVPTYPGVLWSFIFAGRPAPREAEVAAIAERASVRGVSFRYLTPASIVGAFAAPAIVQQVIDPDGPPHTWGPSPEERERAVPR